MLVSSVLKMYKISAFLFIVTSIVSFGILIGPTNARSSGTGSGLYMEQTAPPSRIQQCREGCLEKFATEDFACLQGPECSMSGFPTYNFKTLPDALHLLCWDQCAVVPSKINTSIQDTWPLRTISMVRQGSLVSADVTWPSTDEPSQCLVTWEVSGGGLMGNLLTDSSSVQLSLWPETKYRVQVTCKNKRTELMTRSLPLTLDTSHALVMVRVPTSSTSPVSPSSSLSENGNRIDEPSNHLDDEVNSNSNNNHGGIDDDIETELELDDHNSIGDSLHHRSSSIKTTGPSSTSYGIWTIYESRKEVTMGICAAVTVFLIILAAFIVNTRRSRPQDKESLIDNEVDVDFLPPQLLPPSSSTFLSSSTSSSSASSSSAAAAAAMAALTIPQTATLQTVHV